MNSEKCPPRPNRSTQEKRPPGDSPEAPAPTKASKVFRFLQVRLRVSTKIPKKMRIKGRRVCESKKDSSLFRWLKRGTIRKERASKMSYSEKSRQGAEKIFE